MNIRHRVESSHGLIDTGCYCLYAADLVMETIMFASSSFSASLRLAPTRSTRILGFEICVFDVLGFGDMALGRLLLEASEQISPTITVSYPSSLRIPVTPYVKHLINFLSMITCYASHA